MLINSLMVSVHTLNLTCRGFLGGAISVNQCDRLLCKFHIDATILECRRIYLDSESPVRVAYKNFSSRLGELKRSRHEHNVDYTLLLLFLSAASESSSRGLQSAETNGQTAFSP